MGEELAASLVGSLPGTKVLFTTGYAGAVSHQATEARIGDGLILKPFTPAELAVGVGDSIVFVWDETVDAHNVAQVADANAITWNNGFRSGDIVGGSGYWMLPVEATAADATLYYICEPHASMDMRGSITVGIGDEPADDGGSEGEPLNDDSGLPGPGIVLAGAVLVGAAMRRRH